MSETKSVPPGIDEEVSLFLSRCEEAGKQTDPATAEVDWFYAQTMDPYGVYPDLPEKLQQVGREYFARAPGSDLWVWFGDLPEATETALWDKHQHKLAFPAGLESLPPRRSEIDDPHKQNAAKEEDDENPLADLPF